MSERPRMLASGRYLLAATIGEGGMATVFRGYDTRLQVWRAVKVLNAEHSDRVSVLGRFEAEAFSGREVDRHGDVLDFVVSQVVEIGLSGQPAPDTPVGIFHSALLPTCVGIAKECREAERVLQQFMFCELRAVIKSHGPAHGRVEPGQDFRDCGHGLRGGFAGEPGHDCQPCLTLVQDQKRAVMLADHKVALPVACLGTFIGSVRTLGYMGFSGDPVLRPAGAAAPAGLAAREVSPKLLGFL